MISSEWPTAAAFDTLTWFVILRGQRDPWLFGRVRASFRLLCEGEEEEDTFVLDTITSRESIIHQLHNNSIISIILHCVPVAIDEMQTTLKSVDDESSPDFNKRQITNSIRGCKVGGISDQTPDTHADRQSRLSTDEA